MTEALGMRQLAAAKRMLPGAAVQAEVTPWVLTLFALGELVADQLPKTPSRKTAASLIGRILTGGLSGGAVGTASGSIKIGVILGIGGVVIGTFVGAEARGRLAAMFKKDRPAAFPLKS